jgi:hypothetical protein
MTHDNSAANARYHWSVPSKRIVDHTPHAGEFWKPDFAQINLPDWEDFFQRDDADEAVDSQGHVIVLFWRVLTRLVDINAFQTVNMAPLFRLGFQFNDDDMGLVVSHILRWPDTP